MKTKNNYSIIQYVLWLIAGSEISVLRNCPNEYNRHANIGLMILITSLFAGMTAYVAGNTFEHDNTTGVIIFACIWSLLIFSLDRSMVNSIKKNPTQPEKSIWGYFLPRFILAIILSFFMSIPLDHIVFADNIETQMVLNNQNKLKQSGGQLNGIYNPAQDSLDAFMASKKADGFAKANELPCPLPEYKNKKKQENDLNNNVLPPLLRAKNNADNAVNSYFDKLRRKQTPDTLLNIGKLISPKNVKADGVMLDLYEKQKNAKTNLKEKDDLVWQLRKETEKIYNDWFNSNESNKNEFNRKALESDSIKRIKSAIIDSTLRAQGQLFSSKNGFDVKFTTLFLMPDWGVQILKWLIFLALLVIEILPTYLKLKTPIGQYDWESYGVEKDTETEVKTRTLKREDSIDQIEEYRKIEEIKMNKNLIDKVVSIEEKLANEMLDEWEIKARAQMKRNVEKAQ